MGTETNLHAGTCVSRGTHLALHYHYTTLETITKNYPKAEGSQLAAVQVDFHRQGNPPRALYGPNSTAIASAMIRAPDGNHIEKGRYQFAALFDRQRWLC